MKYRQLLKRGLCKCSWDETTALLVNATMLVIGNKKKVTDVIYLLVIICVHPVIFLPAQRPVAKHLYTCTDITKHL